MLIVYIQPRGIGWHPINYMVKLAVDLFEAELMVLSRKKHSCLKQLEAILLRRQKQKANESALLICPSPTSLLSLIEIEGWRHRFQNVSVWIIDSFWLDRIPNVAKLSNLFDHLFVTTEEDINEWIRLMKTPTTWLPWGTDVFHLGGKDPERKWDLTRIGRQPPEWEDDSFTEKICIKKNISFHGRLEAVDDAAQNQERLMNLYRKTKFVLAFSNTINPKVYTHPTREYLTARWVDALACGAVVAGIPPKEPSINRLLWDGATLDLGTAQIEEGAQIISEAVRTWKAEQAERNYNQALKRLDWRWRFAVIADVMNEPCKRLNDEIQLLKQKIHSLER